MLILILVLLTSGNTYKIHKAVPMENIKEVIVKMDNADVSIQKNDSMHLDVDLVQYRCRDNILNKYAFEVERKKDVVYISVKKKDRDFELRKCSLKLVLEVPFVDVLKVNSLAGDIRVKDSRSDSIEVKTLAGDVYISDFKTDNLVVKVSAGDIRIGKNVIVDNISLETTSGDVYVKKHSEVKKLEITTKSGDIEIEGSLLKKEDKILAEASSGDIKCLFKNIDKGVKISASTKSGDIKSSFPVIVRDDEDCNVIFRAGSGDIIISY